MAAPTTKQQYKAAIHRLAKKHDGPKGLAQMKVVTQDAGLPLLKDIYDGLIGDVEKQQAKIQKQKQALKKAMAQQKKQQRKPQQRKPQRRKSRKSRKKSASSAGASAYKLSVQRVQRLLRGKKISAVKGVTSPTKVPNAAKLSTVQRYKAFLKLYAAQLKKKGFLYSMVHAGKVPAAKKKSKSKSRSTGRKSKSKSRKSVAMKSKRGGSTRVVRRAKNKSALVQAIRKSGGKANMGMRRAQLQARLTGINRRKSIRRSRSGAPALRSRNLSPAIKKDYRRVRKLVISGMLADRLASIYAEGARANGRLVVTQQQINKGMMVKSLSDFPSAVPEERYQMFLQHYKPLLKKAGYMTSRGKMGLLTKAARKSKR